MKVEVIPLEWKTENGQILPKDNEFYSLVDHFADTELAVKIDLKNYRIWASCEVDEKRKPIRVLTLAGMVLRPDFPIMRSIDNVGTKKMIERLRGHLQDAHGARGMEAFIYIPENASPEQMCPDYKKWLDGLGAKPSERVSIII